jgi:hypothetical protein
MSEEKKANKAVLIIALMLAATIILLNLGTIHRYAIENTALETELRLLKERCQ